MPHQLALASLFDLKKQLLHVTREDELMGLEAEFNPPPRVDLVNQKEERLKR